MTERRLKRLEREERLAAIKHKQKIRKMEITEKRKSDSMSNSVLWVWEFSKKVVYICVAFWMAVYLYASVAMWRFFDFTYLGTMIEQVSTILSTCVFGYFIKSGIENVFKIGLSKFETKEESASADTTEQDLSAVQMALTAPDGEES